MSCEGCISGAKAQNQELENKRVQAKKEAIEESKPKAICYDEARGLFIADAYTAFQERYQIRDIVSHV